MRAAARPNASWQTAAAALVALAASCASVDRATPPGWLDSPPIEERFLYGVGTYVGALYPEDNLKYAMEVARGNLSHSMEARVISDTSVRETESSSRLRSETNVSSDYVLRNSEHVDTWVDVQGVRGKRGTVWVLLRVPKK